MKKVFLSLFVLATMFACNAPEKKGEAATSEDMEGGSYVSLDDKTAKVKQMIEAYMKNDTTVAHDLAVDTHSIFSDITVTLRPGDLKTFTGNNGQVATGYWGIWKGKGKYTNAETKVPLHMILWWKGDKIVQIYRIFDPTTLKAEVAAAQKK